MTIRMALLGSAAIAGAKKAAKLSPEKIARVTL